MKYYSKYAKTLHGGGEEESVIPPPILFQAKKKSSQIHKENIGIMMLSNVPYISDHIASELLKPFDFQIFDFLQKIRSDPDYLTTIKVKTRDNKERKLAKNIREILMEYFGES